jgi:transposase
VGVDDFALCKGQRYATLVVDLERRCPIDVLPDRTAETVAQWFRTYPDVQMIARDRSLEYARGATLGAPQAIQVADRWHLLHNLGEMVERVILRRRAQLRRLPLPSAAAAADAVAGASLPLRPRRLRRPTASEQTREQESRARRYNRYDTVQMLLARGLSQRHIARLLGMSRTTVRTFVHADVFPDRAVAPVTASTIDPYLAYLCRRWQEGCHNSQQLWREIRAQGYPNGPRQVMRWAQQRRTEPAPSTPNAYRQARRQGRMRSEPADDQLTSVPLRLGSPRELVGLMLRDPDTLTVTEERLLTYVVQDAHIGPVHELGQQFQQMIRQRESSRFDAWLAVATSSTVPDLRAFAVNIQRDYDAVRAALLEEWSSGQVEGQITRVKLIKRRMYGRATFDLLRQHILCGD